MRKIAFLIMAHHDPVQLKRLIQSLDYELFDIYVHVDKRSALEVKKIASIPMQRGKIQVFPFSFKIYWGDISIVDATFRMYRYVMKQADYLRLVTLSGNDYPIRSNDYIYDIFSDQDVEFIVGQQGLHPEAENYRIQHYHFFKPYPSWFISRVKCYLRKHRIKKPTKIVTKTKEYQVYQASQWHALTPQCVKYILDVDKKEPAIHRYFRYSWAPDELLLATILFNSSYAEKTLMYNEKGIKNFNMLSGITYLEYNPQEGSTVNHLDETKYETIIQTDRLFMRKAVTGKSDKLLDMIDEYRKGIR